MKANQALQPLATAENIIPLVVHPKPARSKAIAERFKIQPFTNPRTGTESWRVTGMKRDGSRVRENFAEQASAQARQIELKTEFLTGHRETEIKATKLTDEQVRLSEAAMLQLGEDWQRIIDAVTYWQQHGKQRAAIESPRLDEAVEKYLEWLKDNSFRDATKRHWKIRMNMFRNAVPNTRVADIASEFIKDYLDKRSTSQSGKDTDRRAISRFFTWCIEKKWAVLNPCRGVPQSERGEATEIKVLSLDECKTLLKVSRAHSLTPYVALCLFGGLRPAEAARLQWESINLADREIRLGASQTKTGRKTGRGRTIAICDTLAAWLQANKGTPIYPANWRKKFDAVKLAAGFGTPDEENKNLKPWPADVMRHTAISHYFRKTGSYGQTAEQFGNSEAIIKAHYQSRVSSEETKQFYALKPTKKGAK